MSDDIIKVEVDGNVIDARKGQMIIEVTDQINAYVPRFCYHEKLSVAANCRMCLVEVENEPKPIPACATPINDGMKIFTRSPKAVSAQKATMEFLLINHPLDCPICDQGGECELQDLAMGYGSDVSRYNETKRVVKDEDIGPLVSTDMTRCIHCTRCIRFGEEITGLQELGAIDRGEAMEIRTYVEQALDHELSSNIIDVCPVGALNNKPYRYSARPWEMTQIASISPHDCVGSNLYTHVLRGTIKRIVPKTNENINENWISDRDRFSYEGVYSGDRLKKPILKNKGKWRHISWKKTINLLSDKLKNCKPDKIGILASPNTTLEEGYLLSELADQLKTSNIDHRLRQKDFYDQYNDPFLPWLGQKISDIENHDSILIIGSNIRKEAPIIGHRIRKAALKGARISFINSVEYQYHFDISTYLKENLVSDLAGVAVALEIDQSNSIRNLCEKIDLTDKHKQIASMLKEGQNALILLGNLAINHAEASTIRTFAYSISEATGASFGFVSEGANSVGLHLMGVLPHKKIGGEQRKKIGMHTPKLLISELDALLLFGAEPQADIPNMKERNPNHHFTVAFTPFTSDVLKQTTDLLIPIGTTFETSGTFVNCEGRLQSFIRAAKPVEESRAGWRVISSILCELNPETTIFKSSEEIRDYVNQLLGKIILDNSLSHNESIKDYHDNSVYAENSEVPMYQIDGLVRRAKSLQLTPEGLRHSGNAE